MGAICFSANAKDYATLGEAQAAKVADNKEPVDRLGIQWKVTDKDRENAGKAWKILSEYNKNLAKTDRKLYAVYVTFKDRPVLDGYKERYDRILKNIQAYYYDQMHANGFPGLTFALDLDDQGKVKLYEAHVDVPMDKVAVRSSGPLAREAAKKVLAEHGVDADKNHIFVVCQLPDGIGPYYGGGSFASGTGWTCDQDGLDTKNFRRTDYFGGRYKTTYGRNATIYIGGTAHELGHSFGLPHTRENSSYSKDENGTSLMGSGNHVYGNELRNEGKGTFLAPTDAMMLASVPLFRGYETGALFQYAGGDLGVGRKYATGDFVKVDASPIPFGMRLSGIVKKDSKNPPYAVIARLNPPGNSDYDTYAVADVPDEDGSFSLNIDYPGHTGYVDVTVYIQYADGTRSQIAMPAMMGKDGLVTDALRERIQFNDVIMLWDRMQADKAREALEMIKSQNAGDAGIMKSVVRWEEVLSGKAPVFKGIPAAAPDSEQKAGLLEYKPDIAKSGWQGPFWNRLAPSSDGLDAFFSTGQVKNYIMNHAPGQLSYDLGGKWNEFSATVGMPCGKGGSIVFEVTGDGKPLFKSKVIKDGESVPVKIPVKGVKVLNIDLQDAGDGNRSDWGLIVSPELSR